MRSCDLKLIVCSLLFVVCPLAAQETYFHAGVGAASGSRFGMPITAGAAFEAGEVPLTILKVELFADAWRLNDNISTSALGIKGTISDSWWGFYEGARVRLEGLVSTGMFPSTQGFGLALAQAIPHVKDGGFGKTEHSLSGMGFVRYDLNPGQLAGLFVELDVWLKLTNRESQSSPPEMITALLGVRVPYLFKG